MAIKNVEVLIDVKYFHRGNKVFQHFCFEPEKQKYWTSSKFILKDKVEEKIKEHAYDKGIFLDRRDEKDRIVLEFSIEDENIELPKNFFFKVADFTPSAASCNYCVYRLGYNEYTEKQEKNFTCTFQNNKEMNKVVKNCQFFKQRRLFKT